MADLNYRVSGMFRRGVCEQRDETMGQPSFAKALEGILLRYLADGNPAKRAARSRMVGEEGLEPSKS